MFGYYGHLPFMNLNFNIGYNNQNEQLKQITQDSMLSSNIENMLSKIQGEDPLSKLPFRLKIENNSIIGIYNFYHKLNRNIDVQTFLDTYLLRIENHDKKASQAIWNEPGETKGDVQRPYKNPEPQNAGGGTKYITPEPAKIYENVKSFDVNAFEAANIAKPNYRPGFPLVPTITFDTPYKTVKELADLDKYFLTLNDITAPKINALGINESPEFCSPAKKEESVYEKVKNVKRYIQDELLMPFELQKRTRNLQKKKS